MYFIRYKPEEHKEPYKAPEALKKQLTDLGVEIEFEGEFFPDIIAKIPDDKVDAVRSLEGIVDVFPEISFGPFSSKPKQGDC